MYGLLAELFWIARALETLRGQLMGHSLKHPGMFRIYGP
jgi:hypothetical protein